ncbi:MAG: RluA family pseudouridine synthase [Candidatus Staskawiczbacteria bacterium]|jgi:23S rRNA pseudouridine1911/1915/1917 synthase
MNIKVLYEDNHIIAVYKPAGVLTQPSHEATAWQSKSDISSASLFEQVKKYLKEKYNKSGNIFLGLVHRLDKPVSGIVLFGKTSKGASRLSEQFRNHTIQKTYHAIVVGKPKESKGELKEKINKISFFAEGFTNKTDEELLAAIKGATKTRTAELSYEVVKFNNEYSLLKVLPKTGRFHQIRVQMNEMGCPILGDVKYSNQKPLPDGSIALCATAIEFKTATTEQSVKLEIPLPESWRKYI